MEYRRLHVTLLEILIVIAVLALISGALVYNINNAVIDQRFRTEVGRVVDTLRLAQDLMLIHETDVHVKFAHEKGGIKYWLEMETALKQPWEQEIKRPLKNLTAIRGVFFNDLTSPSFVKGQIDVKFLSKGSLMSRGVMRLATSTEDNPPRGTLESFICLPGYPHPITSNETRDRDASCQFDEDEIEEQRLTLSTVSSLPDYAKAKENKNKETNKNEGKNNDISKKKALPTS
jgi:type II secretory pathway pseudopilin PulG